MATLEMRRIHTRFNLKKGGFKTLIRLPDVKLAKRQGDSSLKIRWLHLPEIVTSLGALGLFAVVLFNYFN